jgi:ABC-type sugar transport system ATPase subunit
MISHNMEDVLAVAQRVAILKNGIKVGECLTRGLTGEQLATMVMTGNLEDRNLL